MSYTLRYIDLSLGDLYEYPILNVMDACMCDDYTYNPSANLLSLYHRPTIISTPYMGRCIPSDFQ